MFPVFSLPAKTGDRLYLYPQPQNLTLTLAFYLLFFLSKSLMPAIFLSTIAQMIHSFSLQVQFFWLNRLILILLPTVGFSLLKKDKLASCACFTLFLNVLLVSICLRIFLTVLVYSSFMSLKYLNDIALSLQVMARMCVMWNAKVVLAKWFYAQRLVLLIAQLWFCMEVEFWLG
uniref:Uncharacterized protein n=1 Tax=Opuntia streptacantha TaxID=393608 RepID=A0A7C9AET7_OPUST